MRDLRILLLLVLVPAVFASCGVRRTYTDPGGPVYTGDYCPVQSEFAGSGIIGINMDGFLLKAVSVAWFKSYLYCPFPTRGNLTG